MDNTKLTRPPAPAPVPGDDAENDDALIGRVLSRREVWALFGGAGATLLAACGANAAQPAQPANSTPANSAAATAAPIGANPTAAAAQGAQVAGAVAANATALPSCVVRPEVTEGPYYVQEDLVRSDIRSDPATGAVKAGAPLTLTFNVSQIADDGCTPLAGATVEVWHCDAAGQYSDVSDPQFNTKGQKWLRGAQVTDASGTATFSTIYPGWYAGRAVHIHFKIRPSANQVFTSQLFFDDASSDQVFAQAPYASKGKRNVLNSRDTIYQDLLLLTTTKNDQGYAASFPIGVDLSTLGSGQSGPAGGPGGPSGPGNLGLRPGGPPPGR